MRPTGALLTSCYQDKVVFHIPCLHPVYLVLCIEVPLQLSSVISYQRPVLKWNDKFRIPVHLSHQRVDGFFKRQFFLFHSFTIQIDKKPIKQSDHAMTSNAFTGRFVFAESSKAQFQEQKPSQRNIIHSEIARAVRQNLFLSIMFFNCNIE